MHSLQVEFSTGQGFPYQKKKLCTSLDINRKGNVHTCSVNRVFQKEKNSKNVRVKTRIFFGRQRTDLGTRDSGQRSKFIDKTPQGPRSIQLRNRFAVLGELDEEQIHDYCVSKQIDMNNQGSKIGYKSEEKQLSYSHDHVTGERDFSNIHCESVFCKKPQVWPSYDTRDENLLRNFISTQNTGYPTHSEGVHSALHQENQLFGDKYCNNCEIKILNMNMYCGPIVTVEIKISQKTLSVYRIPVIRLIVKE